MPMISQTELALGGTKEAPLPVNEAGKGPEVVPHPDEGFTHAIPIPGTSMRVYEGRWNLKSSALAWLKRRYPRMLSRRSVFSP